MTTYNDDQLNHIIDERLKEIKRNALFTAPFVWSFLREVILLIWGIGFIITTESPAVGAGVFLLFIMFSCCVGVIISLVMMVEQPWKQRGVK